ncbi:uncharacterized protein LOC118201660 [Stegodyphus dumicola]|uniref:uncharacterized protein LOC118201660 n=1 Tax=Stegodyphus dumicola TaxID=202533 RepID=UPI0015B032A7|nr:uncharacterized protein LOC118201660 [Stegodyphus dumicola]
MELYIIIIYCAFILNVFRQTVATISCEEDIHSSCPNKPFIEAGLTLFDEEMLQTHCSDIIEDIECKENYLSICDRKGYQTFTMLIGGFKDTFAELCDENSDLRSEYRRHVSCLRNSRNLYHSCALNAIENVLNAETDEKSNNSIGEWDNENLAKRLCRIYQPIKNCVLQETLEKCGADAKGFLEILSDRFASRFVEEMCN